MKKYILIILITFFCLKGNSQISLDYFVPHFFIGKGIGDMNDIISIGGIGYDVGYELPNSSFGIYGFYNTGSYSRMKEDLPIFRPMYGQETLPIINNSTASTYGIKLRYTPFKFKYQRFNPYIEIGGGFARYKSFWKSNGTSINNVNVNPYIENDEECPKKPFEERERIMRNTTLMSMAEIGFTYRLTKDGVFSEKSGIKDNSGLYLSLSARLEYGGLVRYNNIKNHPYRFYYDSGLSNTQDYPYSHLVPSRITPSNFEMGRHSMLVFQLSLSKLIF
jgi:hypothetical protein